MDWLSQRFELARGGSAHNMRPMEGLRGFAVFLVFIVHFATLAGQQAESGSLVRALADALHAVGNTGVDLFFVLSGYLIYGSLISRPQQFGSFMARRLQRIYPAFLVVFLLYLVLSYAFPQESKLPKTVVAASIFLLENLLLLPGIFPIDPVITVAWSLSYELFYYLAIPTVIAILRLRSWRRLARVLFFVGVTLVVAVYCAFFGGHVRMIMFISGILLHEALDCDRLPTPNSLIALIALALGLATTLLPLDGSVGLVVRIASLYLCFFVVCLLCFRMPSALLPRAFSLTPLRWLGNMSYSYYLLHGLALKGIFLVLAKFHPIVIDGQDFWLFLALLPIMFLATLLPTGVLFLTVERPLSLAHPRMVKSMKPTPGSRSAILL